MKKCRTCKITKELDDFGIRRKNLDGYDNQCKDCQREYQKKYRKGYRKKEEENGVDTSHIDLTGIRRNEWCLTYRILSKMGYNTKDDIHSQFIKSHPNLVYKQRPIRNVKFFSGEDCEQ